MFNINEDGTIDLISSSESNGKVWLVKTQGYNNAVKLLNDACSNLYGDEKNNITARSINIEDIEDKMTSLAWENVKNYVNSNSGTKYNNQISEEYLLTNSYYPQIYAEEKQSVIDRLYNSNGLDLSEQHQFIENTDKLNFQAEESIQPYQTYYWLSNDSLKTAFNNELYYELILPQEENTNYWIASRCIMANADACAFGIRYAFDGYIGAYNTYYSNTNDSGYSMGLRPIISVENSNIKKDTTLGWIIN